MLRYLFINPVQQSLKRSLTELQCKREGQKMQRKVRKELSDLIKPTYSVEEMNDWEAGTEQDFGTSNLFL